MAPLADKVAIVTGGSKGIGKAIAMGLVNAGARVSISYAGDTQAAQQAIEDLGGKKHAVAVQADAGSLSGIDTLISETLGAFGGIDIVIANAGVLPMKDVEHTTEQDFDRTFTLNVKGPYFLVQKCIPHLKSGSSVVLVSTTQNFASTVSPPYTLYCATKGAIDQMVRTMSKDLGQKGISVNAIAPGPTGTDLFYKGKSQEVLNMIAGLNPRNRIGQPDEVAEAAIFLSGPGARWISGQTIRVNGGAA